MTMDQKREVRFSHPIGFSSPSVGPEEPLCDKAQNAGTQREFFPLMLRNASNNDFPKDSDDVNSPSDCLKHDDFGCSASMSFDTLETIDMLTFEFLSKCQSPQDLGRVIRFLSVRSTSPQMLQVARERLHILQQNKLRHVPPPPPPRNTTSSSGDGISPLPQFSPRNSSPNIKLFSDSAMNLSRITAGNTTLDSIDPSRSSLNFSLSPSSVLRGVHLISTPGKQSRSRDTDLNAISESPAEGMTSQKICQREGLATELRELSTKFLSMGEVATRNDQNRIRNHLLVKPQDTNVNGKVAHSNFLKVYEENANTPSERAEAATERLHLNKVSEFVDVEKRLNSKIEELQSLLHHEAESSRLVVGAERKLRTQHELNLQYQVRQNATLNQILRDTMKSLSNMKSRYTLTRHQLSSLFGIQPKKFDDASWQEFLTEIEDQVKSMQSEKKSIQKTQQNAVKYQMQLEKGKVVLEKKLEDEEKRCKALLDENSLLAQKVQELMREVASSRILIDKLLKTTHETREAEWERREKQYKAAIRNYQQSIRSQASGVSLELYKSSIDENKHVRNQLHNSERRVASLERDLSRLQYRNQKPASTSDKQESGHQPLLPTDIKEEGTSLDQLNTMKKECGRIMSKSNDTRVKVQQTRRQNVTFSAQDLQAEVTQKASVEVRNTLTSSLPSSALESDLPFALSNREDPTEDLTGITIFCRDFQAPMRQAAGEKVNFIGPEKYSFKESSLDSPVQSKADGGDKENKGISSPSRTLRMKKARELGGRKGLKHRLQQIRSPPPTGRRVLP